ncbi:DsrE family protein [Sulfuriflexus mobilis]|uniref:DsrE family protein n=1 Tax=Sulfuriflexus mobilis TaxID=1811807 RepID=UPI000F83C99F|nr:DsrE family protein [Sulfuriflexus mobilis]
MRSFKRIAHWTLLGLALLFGSYRLFASGLELDEVLLLSEAPPGVVFEIVSGDNDYLRWAIPAVQQHIQQLRERFPELPVAVVTHGREQFALTRDKQTQYAKVHRGIQSLVKDNDVSVHVCGTYAERHNVDENEFPDYINVSAAGPAQINDYRQLGYLLIKLKRP